ncbi:hypothetical protein QOZ80_5AG0371670 [Eleusine coracana subsp. coracana]|nr:hypothetical protein QOZ80_5AG0371670 [Eleusine coracana subsp. coracana]
MLSSHCDNMLPAYAGGGGRRAVLLDHHHRRPYRPNVEVAPSCPRCDSPNTKFCYYNNYSLSQPRYFCKGCRRYWTKGGSLRNVPVGGGCRKNRRGKSAARAAIAAGGGAAAFSHRFHGAIRPDLLLEGMVGNPAAGLGGEVVSVDKPAGADGSGIDLALLYAKFLNRQPQAVESVDTSSRSSSDVSPNAASLMDQPFLSSQDGFGNLPGPASTEALGELSFSVDQSCYDSLGLPTDDGGGDLILPTTTWHHQAAKYEPFDPLPEEDVISLHNSIIAAGADDVWSNALACQGLEAALCRP